MGRSIHYGWILITLASGILTLTCLQARSSLLTKNLSFINQSSSYAILTLRTLSEVFGILLAATIAVILERIKWMSTWHRVGQKRGIPLVDFLALQEGTTTFGLLSLIAGSAVGSTRARLWGLTRLLAVAVVPIVGVLIMSQVDVHMAFTPQDSGNSQLGFGMNGINGSVAGEFTGLTDLMFSWQHASFLSNPVQGVDLTPPDVQIRSCNLGLGSNDDSGCQRSYFFPGSTIFLSPELVGNAIYPEAPVLLATDHTGYILEFDAGNVSLEFDPLLDCRIYSSRMYTFAIGAIRLCMKSTATNEVQALACSGDIAIKQSCLNDTSWYQDQDWTVKMAVSFRNATVAYSRSNGTILWHDFQDSSPVPANISATEILRAYDSFLSDTTTWLHQSDTPLAPFSSTMLPSFLWLNWPKSTKGKPLSPSISSNVYAMLQSLMGIPLYYCQSGVLRRLIPYLLNNTVLSSDQPSVDQSLNISPLPRRTTTVTFASYRYEALAGTTTLVAYGLLSGIVLLLCLIAQLRMSILVWRSTRAIPEITSFPALDLLTQCTVEDETRGVVYQGRSELGNGAQLMPWLASLRVSWAKTGFEGDELRLIFWNNGRLSSCEAPTVR
ncbi:hypothetical protein GQ53DRAFT_832908 [Thozetella sp. PMI_491]|nr:hypothetical protein GQ53DRAFT_832908 [Thozetella sp. PMI_491]